MRRKTAWRYAAGILALMAVAWAAARTLTPADPTVPEATTVGTDASTVSVPFQGTRITIYRTASCNCCRNYEAYLTQHGFIVHSVVQNDLAPLKTALGVPAAMRSCHTGVFAGYFVEGHVPVEALARILEDQPRIDGIALPGMPAGSPGMTGQKTAPWQVFALAGGKVIDVTVY